MGERARRQAETIPDDIGRDLAGPDRPLVDPIECPGEPLGAVHGIAERDLRPVRQAGPRPPGPPR